MIVSLCFMSEGFAKHSWWAEHSDLLHQTDAHVRGSSKDMGKPWCLTIHGCKNSLCFKSPVSAYLGAKLMHRKSLTGTSRMPGSKLEDGGASILDNWHTNSIDINPNIQFLFLLPQVRFLTLTNWTRQNAHIYYIADPLSLPLASIPNFTCYYRG